MSNAVDRIATPALPAPTRVGQATAIEQSRAVAEVQAAVVVAQQCPRNLQSALAEMRDSCRQTALAERAFYRYSRAGSSISGASVHLARELARCWGNIQYGIGELRRDDEHGQSEMQAWAWDVQTNARSSQTFIVPHKRSKKDKKTGENVNEPLTDLRDIYENNANNGARRLRECIFSVLPPWFVEEAKDLCNKTLVHGGGKPLAQRVADALSLFGEIGVTVGQLEQKLGRARDAWTEHDVAQLSVVFTSLRRGETTRDEEFPPAQVTADEILATRPAAPTPRPVVQPAPAADVPAATDEPERPGDGVDGPGERSGDRPMADVKSRAMFAQFREMGMTDKDAQLDYIAGVIERRVESRKDITDREASRILDAQQRAIAEQRRQQPAGGA